MEGGSAAGRGLGRGTWRCILHGRGDGMHAECQPLMQAHVGDFALVELVRRRKVSPVLGSISYLENPAIGAQRCISNPVLFFGTDSMSPSIESNPAAKAPLGSFLC